MEKIEKIGKLEKIQKIRKKLKKIEKNGKNGKRQEFLAMELLSTRINLVYESPNFFIVREILTPPPNFNPL